MSKNYVYKGFEDKIQINLANISKSKDDQYKFVKALYVVDFTCELCEHQHLSKAFRVQNLNTGKQIDVGSECIQHFRLPQTDLDLAEAMAKRVEKSIRAGRDMLVQKFGKELFDKLPESDKPRFYKAQLEKIEELGNEYLKNLPRSEKTPLFVHAYRMHEAELLMDEVAKDHHVLTTEEVEEILALGLESKKDVALVRQEQERKRKATISFRNNVYTQTNFYRQSLSSLPADLIAEWTETARDLGIENEIQRQIDSHESNLVREREYQAHRAAEAARLAAEKAAREVEYGWIINYAGNNDFLCDLQRNYAKWGKLTPVQIARGKEVLERELNPPPATESEELKTMLDALVAKSPDNTFYRSVRNQYIEKGSLSPKQIYCIRRSYNKEIA